ncbi:hypothetical protein AA0311_1173 [Asaia bogorensis NBRC 16594]|uniref:Uncharacterized protein n=1 Tax=Asaia bogorensis NBRC 16594 TaxID=1231624 RepID=A0AAN4R3H0_9PROT|nr:hypothetical protein Asbog_02362 [Asaia bogorensis NBRC 16594]GBQ76487.1 hypothetical protein AA0311_1173 [Asaia bogorensis NBRC 16594]GEL53627.1 hypothetical protein ABO01nite_16340 [Asaia bogorensis NBRC 16594]
MSLQAKALRARARNGTRARRARKPRAPFYAFLRNIDMDGHVALASQFRDSVFLRVGHEGALLRGALPVNDSVEEFRHEGAAFATLNRQRARYA